MINSWIIIMMMMMIILFFKWIPKKKTKTTWATSGRGDNTQVKNYKRRQSDISCVWSTLRKSWKEAVLPINQNNLTSDPIFFTLSLNHHPVNTSSWKCHLTCKHLSSLPTTLRYFIFPAISRQYLKLITNTRYRPTYTFTLYTRKTENYKYVQGFAI